MSNVVRRKFLQLCPTVPNKVVQKSSTDFHGVYDLRLNRTSFELLDTTGFDVLGGTQQEFEQLINPDTAKFSKIIKEAGLN
jgi:hypothetical protein